MAIIGLGLVGGSINSFIPYTKYKEGIVINEQRTESKLIKSSGALFGNESVKLVDGSYILTVSTDEGNYVFEVQDNSKKSINSLEASIENGSRVKFATIYRKPGDIKRKLFGKDRIGQVPSHLVEVVY